MCQGALAWTICMPRARRVDQSSIQGQEVACIMGSLRCCHWTAAELDPTDSATARESATTGVQTASDVHTVVARSNSVKCHMFYTGSVRPVRCSTLTRV